MRGTFRRRDGGHCAQALSLRWCSVSGGYRISGACVGPAGWSRQIGTLAGQLSPSVGYVVGSRQALMRRFNPEVPRPPEVYVGAIRTAGLDIGVKTGGAMLWAVFAPMNGYYRGALAGTYTGVSGDVAIGLGLGANVLVGGSRRSIALQPLSVEGNVGGE